MGRTVKTKVVFSKFVGGALGIHRNSMTTISRYCFTCYHLGGDMNDGMNYGCIPQFVLMFVNSRGGDEARIQTYLNAIGRIDICQWWCVVQGKRESACLDLRARWGYIEAKSRSLHSILLSFFPCPQPCSYSLTEIYAGSATSSFLLLVTSISLFSIS